VTGKAFHPTTLTYWRRRLARSDRPNRIFDAVRQVVAETGVLSGKTRRVLDSTVLDDAVATQDTVTQLVAAIRRVAREVPGAAEVIAQHCGAHDYTRPGNPVIAWDDPDAREQLVDALVGDAHRLLGHLPEQELRPKAAEAVALLALIAGQDVELVDGSDGTDGRWRIARRVAPDRVISTVDPEARHAHKTRHRRQDGYKAHLLVEPDTGIITDAALTRPAGRTTMTPRSGSTCSPDRLDAAQRGGHTPIIKPWPLRPAVEGGFTLDDFAVDEHAGTATCPNQITRSMTRTRNVIFGGGLPGLPPARPLHHLSIGKNALAASPRRSPTRPPTTRPTPRVPGGLPPAPADGRTLHRLAGRRREPAVAVPRDRAQRPVAAPPRRRAQPTPPTRHRTDPHRHRLGADLNPGQTLDRPPPTVDA
jgi:hypothetical protein